MYYTDLNTEEQLVQATFAEHLETELGWDSVYAWNDETFRANSTLGRNDACEVVLSRDLQRAIQRLNPDLPQAAVEAAIAKLANALVHRPYSQRGNILTPHWYGKRAKVPNCAKTGRIEGLWRISGRTKHGRFAISPFQESTCECNRKP
jgi:type I site-specific restriction-modification system R (restriction) subunit